MPSNRRLRLFFIVIISVVFFILYKTSSSRAATAPANFYSRTKSRLNADGFPISSSLDKIVPVRGAGGKAAAEDDALAQAMSNRLWEAENIAKEKANSKAPTRESVMGDEPKPDIKQKPAAVKETVGGEGKIPGAAGHVGGDRNVAGRKKAAVDTTVDEAEQKKVASQKKEAEIEAEADAQIEAELNSILKMAPIIIFSKSYCPHSKRAKTILLEKYTVTPAPYVVELNEHELGNALQDRLASMTGRRTVPNVLVKGRSIGGGDDVALLDDTGELEAKIRSLGGKAILSVVRNDVDKSR